MSTLVMVLFLQSAAFERYLAAAEARLGLRPAKVVVSEQYPLAAWVQRMPPGFDGGVVYVRPDFLRQAHHYTQRVVADHECCHRYLGWPSPYNEDLMHLTIDGCVEWLLGPSYESVMEGIPCGRWYPREALRYFRRVGRRHCVETR